MIVATLQISKSQQDHSAQRDTLRLAAQRFEEQAQLAAQNGELTDSARAILSALDCERRMAASGPQVLQLIKPRN